MLDADMQRVVDEQRLGFVATVCPDGTPNLSPKGTATVHRDDELAGSVLAFYHQRSGLAADRVKAIVLIKVHEATEVVSPAYDDGSTEEDVARRSLERLGLVRAAPHSGAGASGVSPIG